MKKTRLGYMNREQLVSCMNKTKWRKLAFAMTGFRDFEPEARLKYLGETEPFGDFSKIDWEWVKNGETDCIEWMDIDPVKRIRRGRLLKDELTDFSDVVESALKEIHVPYSVEEGKYRVWGYVGSGLGAGYCW